MDVVGLTADVMVRDLDEALPFYLVLLGRPPDLGPGGDTVEWVLRRAPELALRVVRSADRVGGRVGLAVASVAAERRRLETVWPDLPPVTVKPGVIATLELGDPAGNRVVLWQDLLGMDGQRR